jgi:hypothetical protein
MRHKAIDGVLNRTKHAREDGDYTYFHTLLLAAEALAKTITLGVVACIGDDKERNRYRLEHQLVRADGIGEWSGIIEDALTGLASQYVLAAAKDVQVELSRGCKEGDWQFEAVRELKCSMNELGIISEALPAKVDIKRWFRLFAQMRNKTRGHGADLPQRCGSAARHLEQTIMLMADNICLLQKPWAHLHQNISGKYKVTPIAGDDKAFDFLRRSTGASYANGVYLHIDSPRRVNLIESDSSLLDFFYANGGFGRKTYELLSYATGNTVTRDNGDYLAPATALPPSETSGHGELVVRGKCFTNAPEVVRDYIARPSLESQLRGLLLDDKRHIVTLVGRGGIGKTSLALKVIEGIVTLDRFKAVVWLSARDIDLHFTGPKPVKPAVFAPDEMAKLYTSLVAPREQSAKKDFKPRLFFEQELTKSEFGETLFVFDNFETTQNPLEVFNWIDTFTKLPNKVLITTRLREFKGDYPVEVGGMAETESRKLIEQTAQQLQIGNLLTESYTSELIRQSEGHPYVIKVLLGEVSRLKRAANIPQIVANSEDILTALFERTYSILSPCGQRAFMTLSAWTSQVPRLVLEALLIHSTGERGEVERGVESLMQYSIAELDATAIDGQEFISLPLVASVFGKKKLNVSPAKSAILEDVEVLQMLGATQRGDMHLGLANRLERLLKGVSRRIEAGEQLDFFEPVIEAVCRNYVQGWLLLARWHIEQGTSEGNEKAKEYLKRFLESGPQDRDAHIAWTLMARVCRATDDMLGEVHALVECAQVNSIPFNDISAAANRFNQFLRSQTTDLTKDVKRDFAERLARVMHARLDEANAQDLSRMAWIQIHLRNEVKAREYIERGIHMDAGNPHLISLATKLNVGIDVESKS